jgi:hypothetical protein
MNSATRSAYHEARLGELLEHVVDAVDRFRVGEVDAVAVDAFAVDDVLHHYKRAARELWKFCWLAGASVGVERTARLRRNMDAEGDIMDWWRLARHATPKPDGSRREPGWV